MSTLRSDQVGAGAAVNETTRELAGTMGVAVVGSVFSSLFGPGVRRALGRYVGHGLTKSELNVAASSTHAAQATVAHFPAGLRPGLLNSVTSAFMQGLHRGCFVAAAAAVVAAILVLTYLPQPAATPNEALVRGLGVASGKEKRAHADQHDAVDRRARSARSTARSRWRRARAQSSSDPARSAETSGRRYASSEGERRR